MRQSRDARDRARHCRIGVDVASIVELAGLLVDLPKVADLDTQRGRDLSM